MQRNIALWLDEWKCHNLPGNQKPAFLEVKDEQDHPTSYQHTQTTRFVKGLKDPEWYMHPTKVLFGWSFLALKALFCVFI